MTQVDEKFKDAAPTKTVERIQNILKNNEITVSENYVDSGLDSCHTFRLILADTTSGCNGKGVTRELARASAYAELMERLQSSTIFEVGSTATTFNDAKYFSTDELVKTCGDFFNSIAKAHPKANGQVASANEIAEVCLMLGKEEQTKVIPFFNATKNEDTYFPVAFTKIYSTTGLAAGNSPEEALVQGLSEIFERHCKLRLMREKSAVPTIPDEYLKQFTDTYKSISDIRDAGYDVIVKDCSLDSPFPVLATLLIDKRSHSYHVHLGSHPVFEIALRRTLTEAFQGRTLQNVTSLDTIISANEYKATNTEIIKNMTQSVGTYPAEFFIDSKLEFVPHKNRLAMSNKELLSEMLTFLKSEGYDVLIRDHSCLGFNTFRIIVPGYCEVFPFVIDYGVNEQNIRLLYEAAPGNYYNLSKDKATLRMAVEGQRLLHSVQFTFTNAFNCPVKLDQRTNAALYHLNMAYLSYAAGNEDNALKLLSRARLAAKDYDADFLHCLEKWLKLRPTYNSDEEAATLLAPFYHDNVLSEVLAAVKSGNPFKKYAHCCADTDCETCKHKGICIQKAKNSITSKINNAISAFDNSTAFEKIKSMLADIL